MKLTVVAGDARQVVADVQLVKHFDGRVGGSERTLNDALRGSLRPVFADLEVQTSPAGRLVRAEGDDIDSTRLLVLGLGPLDDFGLQDLRRGVALAASMVLEHGYARVATPVIGTSTHVGLPVDRAYEALLAAFLTPVTRNALEHGKATVEELIVFDADPSRVAFLQEVTPQILDGLGLTWSGISEGVFDLDVGLVVRTSGVGLGVVRERAATFEDDDASPPRSRPDDAGQTKVLFLTANPRNTTRLRLDEEMREVDQAVRQAEHRQTFDLRRHDAVRVSDLQGHLLRYRPHLVHFSGHGEVSSEIVLEDASGEAVSVPPDALARMFSVFTPTLRCVVLSACFSERQAEGIAASVDCVVGMACAVEDKSAIGFARSFYQALAYGCSVSEAFELGCVQVDLESLPGADTPRLLVRNGVDAHQVMFI